MTKKLQAVYGKDFLCEDRGYEVNEICYDIMKRIQYVGLEDIK